MSEWLWSAAALLFVLAVNVYCNWLYARIWGQPLRWRYVWAAHGALLWAKRQPWWEKRP